jgi:hypothetical protein
MALSMLAKLIQTSPLDRQTFTAKYNAIGSNLAILQKDFKISICISSIAQSASATVL